MRGRTARTLARVLMFTVASAVFTFALIAVFGQFRFDSRAQYHAVFSNVSGLEGGNFVRIAGVEVGKVTAVDLHRDGTVTVDFSVDRNLPLTEGTRAVVRYENLIGDRYLALEGGPGSVRELPAGGTIPLTQTAPALDVARRNGEVNELDVGELMEADAFTALRGLRDRIEALGGTVRVDSPRRVATQPSCMCPSRTSEGSSQCWEIGSPKAVEYSRAWRIRLGSATASPSSERATAPAARRESARPQTTRPSRW